MSFTRACVLTIGPLLLVSGAYALSYSTPHRGRSEGIGGMERTERPLVLHGVTDRLQTAEACRVAAETLRTQLPAGSSVIVREPFVLAGDVGETALDRLHRETVKPVTEALWRLYFDRRPDRPVLIVALSNDRAYRQTAWQLDRYEPTAYAGYTQRAQQRIVVNLSTGSGTLTHELSHILAYFDFPEMPEWFDEGLAALHEESTFSADGLTLVGTANWRNRLLRGALSAGELPTLASLAASRSFRGEGENLNYAYVRCFCLYLQERGLLAHFYRKFRGHVAVDHRGLQTLRELLGVDSDAAIERDFREWVAHSP